MESLRRNDVRFSRQERKELVEVADESLDRLCRLVRDLLDANRLQAGTQAPSPRSISLPEVIGHSTDELGGAGRLIRVQLPDGLPEVSADSVLLERVLVNLLSNALCHARGDLPPRITAGVHRGTVEVRVIDHGPGVPSADWERIFLPFQRRGERANAAGLGLGLAFSRDLVEAMGGTITPEVTPGGGLTMTLGLPVADRTAPGAAS